LEGINQLCPIIRTQINISIHPVLYYEKKEYPDKTEARSKPPTPLAMLVYILLEMHVIKTPIVID